MDNKQDIKAYRKYSATEGEVRYVDTIHAYNSQTSKVQEVLDGFAGTCHTWHRVHNWFTFQDRSKSTTMSSPVIPASGGSYTYYVWSRLDDVSTEPYLYTRSRNDITADVFLVTDASHKVEKYSGATFWYKVTYNVGANTKGAQTNVSYSLQQEGTRKNSTVTWNATQAADTFLCNDSNTRIWLDKASIDFNPNGETIASKGHAEGKWSSGLIEDISSNIKYSSDTTSWCTVDANGNITCTANAPGAAGRSAKVTAYLTYQGCTLSATCNVFQTEGRHVYRDGISVISDVTDFPKAGGTANFTVDSWYTDNGTKNTWSKWRARISKTVNGTTTLVTDWTNNLTKYTFPANTTSGIITYKVDFEQYGGNLSDPSVDHLIAGASESITIKVNPEDPTWYFEVAQTTLNGQCDGETISTTVKSWRKQGDQWWPEPWTASGGGCANISYPTGGSGSKDGETFTIEYENSYSSYSCNNITLKQTSGHKADLKINFNFNNPCTSPCTPSYTFIVTPDTTQTVENVDDGLECTVISHDGCGNPVAWSSTESCDWVSGVLNGGGSITGEKAYINYSKNPTECSATRSCTVNFTQSKSGKVDSVSLSQKSSTSTTPKLTATKQGSGCVPYTGGTVSIRVCSYFETCGSYSEGASWTASYNCNDIISEGPTTGAGASSSSSYVTATYTINRNYGDAARECVVTFTIPGTSVSQAITICQETPPPPCVIHTLEALPAERLVPCEGGTYENNSVKSSKKCPDDICDIPVGWSVVSKPSWVTITMHATETLTGCSLSDYDFIPGFNITVAQNPSASEDRTGTIKIENTEGKQGEMIVKQSCCCTVADFKYVRKTTDLVWQENNNYNGKVDYVKLYRDYDDTACTYTKTSQMYLRHAFNLYKVVKCVNPTNPSSYVFKGPFLEDYDWWVTWVQDDTMNIDTTTGAITNEGTAKAEGSGDVHGTRYSNLFGTNRAVILCNDIITDGSGAKYDTSIVSATCDPTCYASVEAARTAKPYGNDSDMSDGFYIDSRTNQYKTSGIPYNDIIVTKKHWLYFTTSYASGRIQNNRCLYGRFNYNDTAHSSITRNSKILDEYDTEWIEGLGTTYAELTNNNISINTVKKYESGGTPNAPFNVYYKNKATGAEIATHNTYYGQSGVTVNQQTVPKLKYSGYSYDSVTPNEIVCDGSQSFTLYYVKVVTCSYTGYCQYGSSKVVYATGDAKCNTYVSSSVFTVPQYTTYGGKNYKYSKVSANTILVDGTTSFIYYYDEIVDKVNYYVAYKDASGNTLKSTDYIPVNNGTSVSSSSVAHPSIEGYTYSSISPSSITANGSNGFTLTYTKNTASDVAWRVYYEPSEMGRDRDKYWAQPGTVIYLSNVTKPTISGWQYKSGTPSSITVDGSQSFTLTYEKVDSGECILQMDCPTAYPNTGGAKTFNVRSYRNNASKTAIPWSVKTTPSGFSVNKTSGSGAASNTETITVTVTSSTRPLAGTLVLQNNCGATASCSLVVPVDDVTTQYTVKHVTPTGTTIETGAGKVGENITSYCKDYGVCWKSDKSSVSITLVKDSNLNVITFNYSKKQCDAFILSAGTNNNIELFKIGTFDCYTELYAKDYVGLHGTTALTPTYIKACDGQSFVGQWDDGKCKITGYTFNVLPLSRTLTKNAVSNNGFSVTSTAQWDKGCVDTNVNYTATSNVSWITGLGRNNFLFNVSENTSDSSRTGTITFVQDGSNKSVQATVIQSGNIYITFNLSVSYKNCSSTTQCGGLVPKSTITCSKFPELNTGEFEGDKTVSMKVVNPGSGTFAIIFNNTNQQGCGCSPSFVGLNNATQSAISQNQGVVTVTLRPENMTVQAVFQL